MLRDPLPLAIAVAGWAAGLLTTALIIGTPYRLFAYHSPELHLVLETADSGVALLAVYILCGRFTRSRRLQDLHLAEGLFFLGLAGVGLTNALRLLSDAPDESIGIWLPLVLRGVGAGLILAAALAKGPRSRKVPPVGA